MNNTLKMIYLIFTLTLNFSCVEKKPAEKNKPELVSNQNLDTLKFTAGINSIFQDSKGNFWIGSRKEGVSFFDGQSFKYFTTNEGLLDNQIR